MALRTECEHTDVHILCPQCDREAYARSKRSDDPEPTNHWVRRALFNDDNEEEEFIWDS